jgi:hypothetical protein
MFGLFKSKPTEREAIAFAEKLANGAVIEAVLEQGRYVGFLIHIDQSGSSLAPYFVHEAARSLFVEIVEILIQDGDFDPRPMNRAALGLPPIENDGRGTAKRALLGRSNASLMQWSPPQ